MNPLVLTSKLQKLNIKENETANFEIEVSAEYAIPRWYKNDVEIHPGDDDRYIIKSEGKKHTLTIKV